MCRLTGQKLLVETSGIYESPSMQAYIQQELHRPCKRWVVDVLNGSREASEVRLKTAEFVLLPDTERVNRYYKTTGTNPGQPWEPVKAVQGWRGQPDAPTQGENEGGPRPRLLMNCKKGGWRQWGTNKGVHQIRLCPWHQWREPCWPTHPGTPVDHDKHECDKNGHDGDTGAACRWRAREQDRKQTEPPWPRRADVEHVNWLAIASEPGLRSLRDLRGRHVPMLRRMLLLSKGKIHAETGVQPEEIMAYVHYPPSVYQLHVHFAYPYAQYNQRDVFRIHSLETVINNLQIDPEYYAKATLQVSLGRNSLLHQICRRDEPGACPHDPVEGRPVQRRKSV